MKKSFLYLELLAIKIFNKLKGCYKTKSQSKKVYLLRVLICWLTGILLVGGNATAMDKYPSIIVNVLTAPAHVAYAVELRAKEFTKMTGANVTVQRVKEYNDLYKIMMSDFSSGKNYYNAVVYPAMWMPDYADPGYIEDLTERIRTDVALAWNDIVLFFRKFIAVYKERAYCLPLDGDFQMLYYRSDIFNQKGLSPPVTWEEYLETAKALHGLDMNNDGIPDYGSYISRKPGYEAYWYFLSIAAALIQSKGTSQGIFFDIRDMKPLVNNEAYEKALDIYVELMRYGPPNELELDTDDLHCLFIEGRCGMAIAWGDIGIMATTQGSKVKDRVGATILPGSRQVLDFDAGKLVDCDDSHCPYAINGINHTPFAAFGGWAGSINAKGNSKTKDAAYAFYPTWPSRNSPMSMSQ